MIAVLCSDLHLSERPPRFRAAEPDWFAAMARPLAELDRLAKCCRCPIVCAGDLFHRWDPGPALINFALEHLPVMHAVPGQHDLRNHNYNDVTRTAYWTMVQTGRVIDLKPGNPFAIEGALLHAFPWTFDITPCTTTRPLSEGGGIHVAVAHQYLWTAKTGYPGAPEEGRLGKVREKLQGYQAAVFGDNHQGFVSHQEGGCTVLNCGGFMRRNSDQLNYRPRVGLLKEDGSIDIHALDVSEDKVSKVTDAVAERDEDHQSLHDFLHSLGQVPEEGLDYESVLRCYCEAHGVSMEARRAVSQALEEARR